jgi:ribose-phosphate pyrophosphokinase
LLPSFKHFAALARCIIGRSPSGKAPGFDPGIRRFDPCPANFFLIRGIILVDSEILVFSGRSNPTLSQAIAQTLNQELGRLEVVRFSDGELSVEIEENVRGRDIFVVQSTSNPGNDHLMELLIVLDALKRASAWLCSSG